MKIDEGLHRLVKLNNVKQRECKKQLTKVKRNYKDT